MRQVSHVSKLNSKALEFVEQIHPTELSQCVSVSRHVKTYCDMTPESRNMTIC
jgi:hypothetical protein